MMPHVEILLVEDSPADAELTLHALRRENLANRVHIAADGEEALDYLFGRGSFAGRNLAKVPRMVLLDLNLPKVSGMEVLRQIKASELTRHIPVIALTASKLDRHLIECYRLGVNSFIQKPVDFHQFRNTVLTLGLYWLAVDRTAAQNCAVIST